MIRPSMPEFEYVKLVWVDLAGVRRARFVRRDASIDEIPRTRVATVCSSMPAFADTVVENSAAPACGEFAVCPASEAFQVPGWEGLGTKESSSRAYIGQLYNRDGTPSFACGRALLKAASELARSKLDCEVTVGFEIEFVLIECGARGVPQDPNARVDNDVYASSAALCQRRARTALTKMVNALSESGLAPLQFHAESAFGQFEMSFQHTACAEAVDGLIMAQEIIQSVAGEMNLVASFLPKLSQMEAGNSTHCHIGLVNPGNSSVNQLADPGKGGKQGLSKIGEGFMAGILDHLPAILALTTSSPNSFERLKAGCWAGAFQCWGIENREVPLRLCTSAENAQAGPFHFEFKSFDATANPYLGVAAMVFSGVEGALAGCRLPEPCNDFLQASAEGDKDLTGKYRHLPSSCEQAAGALKNDKVLQRHMPPELVQTIVALRIAEHKHFEGKPFADQVSSLLQRY